MKVDIHATPGARRTIVGGEHDGALRVSVSAPADKGRANAAIIQALAKALGLRGSRNRNQLDRSDSENEPAWGPRRLL